MRKIRYYNLKSFKRLQLQRRVANLRRAGLIFEVRYSSRLLQRWRKLRFFCGLIAPKPYVPHRNSRTRGTSVGCRLAAEMIPIAQHCAAELRLDHKDPTVDSTHFSCFVFCFYAEIRKFFTDVCMRKQIHVFYFKNGQNRFRTSCRKATLYW